jgi:hypothetical protein
MIIPILPGERRNLASRTGEAVAMLILFLEQQLRGQDFERNKIAEL